MKNRRRRGWMPWRRAYVANSPTISGYRDERKIQNGAETSVKTAVKRSNYAIARHLRRCILYRRACGRTRPRQALFANELRDIRSF